MIAGLRPGSLWIPTEQRARRSIAAVLGASIVLALSTSVPAEQVPVREQEGLTHGFLALRGMDGKKLADGEMTEIATKDHVTSKTTFRFYDGSLYEDTTVFTQNGRFRVLSDDLVEKGPSFKQAIETSLNTATGKVVVRYDDGGRQKTIEQKLALPEDLANGVVFTIIKDIAPNAPETTVTMLVATPRPQLVKLVITPESHSKFTSGSFRHQAAVFDVKVQIGGITGWVAKVTGKQPPDTHVWVLTGAAPSFLKSQGPLFSGGPIWTIELDKPRGLS